MKFTRLFLLLLLFQSTSIIGEEISETSKRWYELIEQYKIHMVVGEWNGAIQAAETLIEIDPGSSEAKFYLVYAVKKTGAKYPSWVGIPSTWPYVKINDRYYVELAKQLWSTGS